MSNDELYLKKIADKDKYISFLEGIVTEFPMTLSRYIVHIEDEDYGPYLSKNAVIEILREIKDSL